MSYDRVRASRFLREIRVTLGIEAGVIVLVGLYGLHEGHPAGYAAFGGAAAMVGFAVLAAKRPVTSCIGSALTFVALWLAYGLLSSMAFVIAMQTTAILALLLFVPLFIAGHAAWQLRQLGPDLDDVFR
jgi:hypothetical protein